MSYNCRRTLFLGMTCVVCFTGHVNASTRSTLGALPHGGNARFVVYRIPTMGKWVIVQVYVDNVVVGVIGYGHKYEGFLTPGHHVLSALATPRPTWHDRPPTIVNVRSGRTYTFTAMGNGAGNLMLWNNKDPRPPRDGVFPRPMSTAAR